jgi:hypothetical protein
MKCKRCEWEMGSWGNANGCHINHLDCINWLKSRKIAKEQEIESIDLNINKLEALPPPARWCELESVVNEANLWGDENDPYRLQLKQILEAQEKIVQLLKFGIETQKWNTLEHPEASGYYDTITDWLEDYS